MTAASITRLTHRVRISRSTCWILAVAGVAVLWPIYAYASSQSAWLISTAVLAVLAADLSARRSPLLAALLLGVVAILGTEANGTLAAGHAPLGTLRTLDVVLIAAVAPQLRSLWSVRGWTRPSASTLLIVSLVLYAVVLWGLNGQPMDALTRTDVRVAGLAAATWIVVRDLGPWKAMWVARVGAAIVLITAAKATALFLGGYWTIGIYDRIQAATLQPPGESLRVVLVGGDSLMTIAPACAFVLFRAANDRLTRWALAGAGAAAIAAIMISGTRTSIVIAVLLLCGAAAIEAWQRRYWIPSRRALGVFLLVGSLAVGGLVAMGTVGRFTQADAPATGLDFRRLEIKSFLELPTRDLLLGQGIGGRYVGKSVLGTAVQTGWSHSFPVVIVLKTGVIGLLITLAVFGMVALRSVRAYVRNRAVELRALILCGATAVLGILGMSLTLGRVALPEGAVILTLALAMLMSSGGSTACER